MMVTVATSLDVPIKLVFPGGGILGLGDIILPGLMIALALRFDLYLHYLSQKDLACSLPPSKLLSKTKPIYHPATGHWGERFWTSSLQRSTLPHPLAGFMFKKTYFYSSLVGYTIGMIATYTVLIVFEHGQPALMYLVPTVLISLWAIAAVRGDLAKMWGYAEGTETEKLDIQEKSIRGRRVYDGLRKMESAVATMGAGTTSLRIGLRRHMSVQAVESSIETIRKETKRLEATLDGFLQDLNAERDEKTEVAEKAENRQNGESESKATSTGKHQGGERLIGTCAKHAAHHVIFFSLSSPAGTQVKDTIVV
jgi:Signal peptide peptidase